MAREWPAQGALGRGFGDPCKPEADGRLRQPAEALQLACCLRCRGLLSLENEFWAGIVWELSYLETARARSYTHERTYVYIYIYMHANIHACTCAYESTFAQTQHTYMHIHMCVHICRHTYAYLHVELMCICANTAHYTYVHRNVHTCAHAYISERTYVHIQYTYIHKYIGIHMNIYIY